MNTFDLVAALEDAGHEARSYSGRCMYGRTCVGVVVPRGTSEFTLALEVARAVMNNADNDDKAFAAIDALALLPTSSDAMGLDTILYWPDVPWVEIPDEEE